MKGKTKLYFAIVYKIVNNFLYNKDNLKIFEYSKRTINFAWDKYFFNNLKLLF